MKIKIKDKSCLKFQVTKKNKYKILILWAAVISGAAFILEKKINADNSITQIDQQTNPVDDTQSKIDELQRRADIYRQIIDIKRQQSDSLNNQLSETDTNIQQVQSQIDASTQQINDFNSQIISLTAQIKQKQDTIDAQKKLLSNLMQSFYTISQTSFINTYLIDGNFSAYFIDKDYISQEGDKINGLIDSISQMKQTLEAQSADLDQKKSDVVLAQQKLQDQNDNLQSIQDQKTALLTQTKGEEAMYSQLLQRVEQQKQQLLDIDQLASSNISIGGLSVSDYIAKNQPPSSLDASLSWYYSQRDPRWGDNTIGNSNSTLKAYGCAVTSVAMVFTEHGNNVTPAFLVKQPIFSWDLISWPTSWPQAKLAMSSDGMSHGNINWSTVDSQLAKGNPVIVYIGKTQGLGGHYVVIHHKDPATGKYVVHDPYFGPNLYLDTSRALIGSMGVQSGTTVDQMIIYN